MKARSLVPWLILTLPAPVFSQSVAGKVVDLAERRPLSGISVFLRNVASDSVAETRTDADGLFYLFPSEGTYVLVFRRGPDILLFPDTLTLGATTEFQKLFVLEFPPTDFMNPQDVDRHAVPLTRFRIPFPESALRAGAEGVVLTQFVVDTTGKILPETIRIVRSSDQAFSNAVRQALVSARFQPASYRGRKVRQLAQMPFHFCLATVTVRVGAGIPVTSVEAPPFARAECESSR